MRFWKFDSTRESSPIGLFTFCPNRSKTLGRAVTFDRNLKTVLVWSTFHAGKVSHFFGKSFCEAHWWRLQDKASNSRSSLIGRGIYRKVGVRWRVGDIQSDPICVSSIGSQYHGAHYEWKLEFLCSDCCTWTLLWLSCSKLERIIEEKRRIKFIFHFRSLW